MSIRQPKRQKRIVAQDFDDGGNVVALDLDGQLAERDLGADQLLAEAVGEIGGELVEGFVHQGSGTRL